MILLFKKFLENESNSRQLVKVFSSFIFIKILMQFNLLLVNSGVLIMADKCQKTSIMPCFDF